MIQLRIIPASGLHYYDLKNFGAKHSKGELIIFLDSDVIPENGWLIGLLESFQRPDVLVVGGNTYMTEGSLYEKSLALLYFFPRGSDTAGCICEVCESEDFFC
jgi:cellulose synthase/poly-beta-1,6-N-acetylglucosamine synthase-like glycosyltransferase